MISVKKSDRGDEGNDESRVGGRHMAVGHGVADVPTVFYGVHEKFYHLGKYSDEYRDDEHFMAYD